MLTNASVIYCDPFVEQTFTFDGKQFGIGRNRDTKVASRVAYSDIIIHSFKASASAQPSELKTMVEIKMYEEAGLDLQKQYKITYITKEIEHADMCLVECFAIEVQKCSSTLATVLKQEKYIDFLALPFLAFSSLYTHKVLAPKNDLFVFIDKQEAFLALYKEGKYIATKSLFTLEEMYKRLKREGYDVSYDTFESLLVEKGLEGHLYEDISFFTALQTLFVEIFTKINDVLMYNRNVFGIDHIDRIFMSTRQGRLKGLRTFLQAFDYSNVSVHDFHIIKDAPRENAFGAIVALYASLYVGVPNHDANVTFFVRPPLFRKTEVGKLTLYSIIVAGVSGVYPLYLWGISQQLESQMQLLQTQNENVKKSTLALNTQLSSLKKEITALNDEVAAKEMALSRVERSIDSLYKMQSSSGNYVDFIMRVNRLLKEYSLMVHTLEQKGTHFMVIEVVAKPQERDNIAKFMKALLQEGFVGVNTQEVRLEKSFYMSKIEISR